jgi:hypothetical protein
VRNVFEVEFARLRKPAVGGGVGGGHPAIPDRKKQGREQDHSRPYSDQDRRDHIVTLYFIGVEGNRISHGCT